MEINIKWSFKVLSLYNGIMTVAVCVDFGDGEKIIHVIAGKEDEIRAKLEGFIDDSAY